MDPRVNVAGENALTATRATRTNNSLYIMLFIILVDVTRKASEVVTTAIRTTTERMTCATLEIEVVQRK